MGADRDGETPAAREAALIADLSRPENLPADAGARHSARAKDPVGAPDAADAADSAGSTRAAVEVLTTHGSLVFRTPQRVYKCKRAKDYGFFDYTTPEKRAHFCAEEVRLNRRGAPDVYLGVLPVWRDERGFSLVRAGPPGTEADWAVCMRTLPDAASALAQKSGLTVAVQGAYSPGKKVRAQSPAKGAPIRRGQQVTLTF